MKSIISPLHKNIEILSATVVHSEQTTSKGASRILKRLATLLLFITHSLICMDGHCMTGHLWTVLLSSFHHCCQLKSSLLPKTKKNPRIVAKMTVFPVRTSAHAPQ